MRILHTADLHLGRTFAGLSLEDDHDVALGQIVEALRDTRADVLLIAGDVFDRAVPPASAVRQFNAFLSRVAAETTAAVVMIAGNHDSGDRIATMSLFTDPRRALIRGVADRVERPLLLTDTHGPVAFSALPFTYEHAARECFADPTIDTPEDVLRAQIDAARLHVPAGARWVVVAHAFVSGAHPSEGERPLARVGGVETVSTEVFAGAHYVALGHLHRPQSIGVPHIRYSGAPLAFGFDEAGHDKSMTLVEMDGAGHVFLDFLPFHPARRLRVIRGRHAALLAASPSNDIVKAILTDETPVIDAMRRLRDVFPHACELGYERDERAPETKSLPPRPDRLADPVEVVASFVAAVRDAPMTDAEAAVLHAALDGARDAEAAA